MDDTFGMVRDMVARLLADRATASGTMAAETRGIDSALWSAFDELGLRGDTAEIGLEGQMFSGDGSRKRRASRRAAIRSP